jgi:hypothetical protein
MDVARPDGGGQAIRLELSTEVKTVYVNLA